eukprot:30208-Hanusia_phi.AAC.1
MMLRMHKEERRRSRSRKSCRCISCARRREGGVARGRVVGGWKRSGRNERQERGGGGRVGRWWMTTEE